MRVLSHDSWNFGKTESVSIGSQSDSHSIRREYSKVMGFLLIFTDYGQYKRSLIIFSDALGCESFGATNASKLLFDQF